MISLKHFQMYCEIMVSPDIIKKALKVSVIVGTVLNLINQGELLFALDVVNLNFFKLGLTYLVPYSVTTYTATSMQVEFKLGTKAVVEADLQCKKCEYEVHVLKDELVPECPTCGIKTQWKLK